MAVGSGSTSLEFDDPRFRRTFTFKVWQRSVGGALFSAISVSIIAVFGAPTYLAPGVRVQQILPVVLTIVPVTWIVAVAIGASILWYVSGWAFSWAHSGRSPSPSDVLRVARIPRIAGVYVAGAWIVFVPLMLVWAEQLLDIRWTGGVWQVVILVMSFGAISAAFAAFIFTEQAIRPALSRVLPADTNEWPRTLGVTGRLIILSVVVAGGPLLVIAFVIARFTPEQRGVAGPGLVVACILFAMLGFVVFAVAGRALTMPLERLRTGLRDVTAGDLDATVGTVEVGEIGLLQAGFNQMVAGLRERERLRDVFGRHVGADVARLAMESDFGTGGEHLHATVMFVDIIGSTALTQRQGPNEVVAILNQFFDAVVRVVAAEGGFINKFLGDGALCVFGAPTSQDDHAARALRAARALARELGALGDIGAVIGIGSGDVVAGNVGAADRYEFTVIGDAVNEASRLCDAAKLSHAKVLASDRAVEAAGEESSHWLRGEPLALRGRAEPTLTYTPASI